MTIFHLFGVVARGSETQLQVGEKLNKLAQQDGCQWLSLIKSAYVIEWVGV